MLWRQSLVEIIYNTAIRRSTDMETQFNELIVKPSLKISAIGPVVIVIDALDESGGREERRPLLDILFSQLSALPINYRVILTTRPESDIVLRCQHSTVFCKWMGDVAANQTLMDIQSYVSFRLEPIAGILDKITTDWREVLAEHAEGLFQWAETACRYIDPTIQYVPLIEDNWNTCISNSSSSLYELYHRIISQQREFKSTQFMNDFKIIIGAIMTAREPLTMDVLEKIFEGAVHDVRMTLYPFNSLLLGVHDPSTPLRPLHTSLLDFFHAQYLESKEKNQYYVNTSDQSIFTLGCVKVMNRLLCFNICNLETSHVRNQDVPDFTTRVKEAIPRHLLYACRFWALHLRDSHDRTDLITQLHILMQDKILYLFEALGLLGEVERGCVGMRIMQNWCNVGILSLFEVYVYLSNDQPFRIQTVTWLIRPSMHGNLDLILEK